MPNRLKSAANDDGCGDHHHHHRCVSSSIHRHHSSAQINRLLFISNERKRRRRRRRRTTSTSIEEVERATTDPLGRMSVTCLADQQQLDTSAEKFPTQDGRRQVTRDKPQLQRPDHQATTIELIQRQARPVVTAECTVNPAKSSARLTAASGGPPAAKTTTPTPFKGISCGASPQMVAIKLVRPLNLLSVCVLAICLVASGAKLQEAGQSNLPTVIVRGFLNYRTTVDGTVLLFTPDAGTGVQPPPVVATSQQSQLASSQLMAIGATSLASSRDITQSQLVLASTQLIGEPMTSSLFSPSSSLAATSEPGVAGAPLMSPSMTSLGGGGGGGSPRVEPTSVMKAPLDGPTSLLAAGPMSQWQADDPFAGNGRGQPLSNEQTASGNEWRPMQATPPLERPSQPPPTSTLKDKFLADQKQASSSSPPTEPPTPPKDTPSVQADDIHQAPPAPIQPQVTTGEQPPAAGSSATESSQHHQDTQSGSKPAPPSSTALPPPTLPGRLAAGRPKRPSLGFHGQAIRGRAHLASNNLEASVAPSSSSASSHPAASRARDQPSLANNQPAPHGIINGIRRPGLSGGGGGGGATSSSSSTTASPAINGEPVASAFQNRLANANLRLRNRFKHRNQQQQATSNQPVSAGNSSLAGPSIVSLVPPTEGGSNQLLDVATIERPVALVGGPSAVAGPRPEESPAVGSEEVLISAASLRSGDQQPTGGESDVSLEPVSPEQQVGSRVLSRAGEQRPSEPETSQTSAPRLLSGALQQGQLSSGPLNLEALFQSDQPTGAGGVHTGDQQQASEQQVSHLARAEPAAAAASPPTRPAVGFSLAKKSHHNEKLNGWLGHHHNRFVPRPAPNHDHPPAGHLSHQLAASLGGSPSPLSPSFSSHLPAAAGSSSANLDQSQAIKSTPVLSMNSQQHPQASSLANDSLRPSVGVSAEELGEKPLLLSSNGTTTSANGGGDQVAADNQSAATIQLQTITKTYSTIMTSVKTRLVPLQVKSSTAIHTITEQYVMTKLMTAYQTIPAGGEFILTEPLSTRAPFELFNESPTSSETANKLLESQPATQSGAVVAPPASSEQVLQEQPISLDPSPKSANDWLHDFSNSNDNNNNDDRAIVQQQQLAASLLEQQAREANSLAALGFPSGNEPLDQLASTLDPAALLADGTINIPDLNNPIVLAAAIQNPQLAAVILAAQQLQLKQRQNKQQQQPNGNGNFNQQQIAAAAAQLQPSYSTSLSTTIKQSTYTVRDTMYTTRLVSFKDGRTVRTRTVSEPGSVIEQVLTTMATEVTPVTMTIRPTAPLGASLATAALGAATLGGGGGGQQAPSSQSTISNALFAAQLASLLARRQQQLQPSLGPQSAASNQLPLVGNSASPQQLLAFQQLLQQQQRSQSGANNPVQAKQFQPNLQQLLQSMQQQQQQQSSSNGNNNSNSGQLQQQQTNDQPNRPQAPSSAANAASATPALPIVPSAINVQPTISGPITTTLTSLQVRTYTVHNAFKTIYRTITSTQLLTSTIYPPGLQRSTTMPSVG